MSYWRDLFAALSGSDNDDKTHTPVSAPSAALAPNCFLSSLSSLSTPECGENEDEGSRWRDAFEQRAAHQEYDAGYCRAAAERLAWAECEMRWHMEHGERVPRDVCAGCRRPLGEAAALDLIDGNRVHDRPDHACLIRHGGRWRAAATGALLALGLAPAAEQPAAEPPPGASCSPAV